MGRQMRKSKRSLAMTASQSSRSETFKMRLDEATLEGSTASSKISDVTGDSKPQETPSSLMLLPSAVNGPCTCQNIQGEEHEIDLFLPKCLPCICRLHIKALEDSKSSNPKKVALKNVLRPWQADFLASVGIERVSQLGRAYKNNGKDLARCLRKWCGKNDIKCEPKEAGIYALHIWARTCRNVKQIVAADNFADMVHNNNDTTTMSDITNTVKPISPQDIPALSKLPTNFFKSIEIHPSPAGVVDFCLEDLSTDDMVTPVRPSGSNSEFQRPGGEIGPDDEWWKIQPKIEQQLKELEEVEQHRQKQIAMEQALTFENTRWEQLAHEAPELSSTRSLNSGASILTSQSEPRGNGRGAAFRGLYKKVIDNLAEEGENAEDYSIYKCVSPPVARDTIIRSNSNQSVSLSDHFQRTSVHHNSLVMKKGTLSVSGRSDTTRTTASTSLSQLTERSTSSAHNSDPLLNKSGNTILDNFDEDDDDSTDYDFALMANQEQKSLFTKGRRRVHEEWEDHNDETSQGELAEPVQLTEKRRVHPWDFSQSKRIVETESN
mmetsp:Transcript_3956/g.4392  ORF Transcript_3956/g.4392 Transcript_3956/m.4392 type:complete len:549 (-) Transcript_3956:123-1769(-)